MDTKGWIYPGVPFDSSRVGGLSFVDMGSIPLPVLVDNYTVPYAVCATSATTLGLTGNRCYFLPFLVTTPLKITYAAIQVTTLSTGTGYIGLYDITTARKPYNRLWMSSGLDMGSTGEKSDMPNIVLPPSMYWLALVSSSAAEVRAINIASLRHLAITLSGNAHTIGYYYSNASLPTDASGVSFTALANKAPAIGVKWSE